MSNYKMSEVFTGTVKVAIYDGANVLADDIYFELIDDDQLKAMAHAINSHDALTAEVSALNSVINEIRSMVTDVQDGFEITGGDAEILDVLNEHWSQNNEKY
jgi:hypothetical protein